MDLNVIQITHCACCGKKSNTLLGPYNVGPYKWVCDICHDLPFTWYPDKKKNGIHVDGKPNIKTWSLKEPGWSNCKKCEDSVRQEELEVFDGICQECYSKEESF